MDWSHDPRRRRQDQEIRTAQPLAAGLAGVEKAVEDMIACNRNSLATSKTSTKIGLPTCGPKRLCDSVAPKALTETHSIPETANIVRNGRTGAWSSSPKTANASWPNTQKIVETGVRTLASGWQRPRKTWRIDNGCIRTHKHPDGRTWSIFCLAFGCSFRLGSSPIAGY